MFGGDVVEFVKQLKQIFPDVARDTGPNILTTIWGYITQPCASPKSNIPGLHYVKQYLNYYGYLQDSYGSSFTDEMDQNTVSAIKQYQKFFRLHDTTGNLNQETLDLISRFRCGVPDDIMVGLQNFNDKMVVGVSLIELSVSNNDVGYMLLDANNKNWALPNVGSLGTGGIDLGAVAMHQIGHLIGLSHSGDSESVMYPYILPGNRRKVQLSNDDIQQIKQLSSANGNGNGVGSSHWGLITTFLLGFPCLFLLY
ncbi:Metalloendoproteinase 2-MMP [Arachis hypogaea]|nr:Metalloendoproteinase 2-MMP [Arachis hypogaea]